ncbi:MAG: flagellar hook-basal body complex protein [Rhodospirillales bacterium]|nr:flagellar hook-basal body complex protein [Rhodospirillales bacterium]
MSLYGAFAPSTLGMLSQSFALNTIGVNVANANTGGYKMKETRFSSMVSRSLFHESDLGGIRPNVFQRLDAQGVLVSSDSQTDLAISGNGFFVLSDQFSGGRTFYGRDGSFQMRTVNDVQVTADDNSTITVRDGYLADKNGFFVMGWQADANGEFPSSGGTLTPLRIDPYAFADTFETTTSSTLVANLPANAATGEASTYSVTAVDSAGTSQTVTMNFTKLAAANQWEMSMTTSRDPTQVDTVTLAGTLEVGDIYSVTVQGQTVNYTVDGTETDINDVRDALVLALNNQPTIAGVTTAAAGAAPGELTITADVAGDAFTSSATATNGGVTVDNTADHETTTATTQTTAAQTLTFNGKGELTSPTGGSVTFAMNFAGGTTATVAYDISELSQFSGDFLPISFDRNGFATSSMESFTYDASGRVIGTFEDSTQRVLYKIPLAIFPNVNSLEERNGNVYVPSADSGEAQVVAANSLGAGTFLPSALELSNVDIAEEFSTMIMVQNAYTMSSKAFQTADEMLQEARDLKR